jgi:methylthioribose-1-phosphate isomerase
VIPLPLQPLRWEGDAGSGRLWLVDQTRLPQELVELECANAVTLHEAIRTLRVRGAPAIGLAAAHGLVLALQPFQHLGLAAFERALASEKAALVALRPTAVNLRWAAELVAAAAQGTTPPARLESMHAAATRLVEDQSARSLAMAEHGLGLLGPGEHILTICNAGPLAAGGLGTALGVVLLAAQRGLKPEVFACETRPLLQGARLTAFELVRAGVPVTLLSDGAAAQLLASGRVTRVLVGADRIARNGDTANKIGTYALALAAKAHAIPFHVVAPLSTVDANTLDGRDILVEQRPAGEVLECLGQRVAAPGAHAINPAFDVTPAALITSIITEHGVTPPESLVHSVPSA